MPKKKPKTKIEFHSTMMKYEPTLTKKIWGGGGGGEWDFQHSGKVSLLQVLKKYYTANGIICMWTKVLSIECMIQLRFAILEKNIPLPDKNPA